MCELMSKYESLLYIQNSADSGLFKLQIKDGDGEIIWRENSISDAVSRLLDMPEYLKARREKTKTLRDFRNRYIKGHTQEQWDLAKSVQWSMACGKRISETAVRLQIPMRVAEDALLFSTNIEQYKDSHKEI